MLRATMTKPGEIVFENIQIPDVGDNQVLLKMARIGVCGSDMHVYHGKHPYTSYPVVQGHEVTAIVEKCGSGVKDFAPGDRVTVQPQVFCGKCAMCREGDYHICESLKVMGFQTEGMAQEYFLVDQSKVIHIPNELDLDSGALIEPVAVGVHAVRRLGNIKGKKVLVFGAGPIGNLTAQVAKAMGAASVMITDISDYRIQKAYKCGIDFCINTAKEDLKTAVLKNFGEDGADAIFECIGIQPTMDQAVAMARKGTTIMVVGVFGDIPRVDLGLVQDRELTLRGTLMYKREDFDDAISFMASGKIIVEPLISRHFAFKEYLEAYKFIEESKDLAMKVLIDIF